MYVTKRSGVRELVAFDKISNRISTLDARLDQSRVNVSRVAQAVIAGLYDGVPTTELDVLAAETCASFVTSHSDYGKLAGYIAISNLHKETPGTFVDVLTRMYQYENPKTQISQPMITSKSLASLAL